VLKIASESHLFGETIVEHNFPHEYEEIFAVVGGMEIPLRPSEPFTPRGRPATPKRQKKSIGGKKAYALFPVHQAEMNSRLHDDLRARNWDTEPVAAGRPLGTPADVSLRGDFAKNGVFVEVEFGNSASLFRDLFKFQIASRSSVGEAAVLIVATAQLAKFFDSGVATYEQAVGLLPYMRIGIQMPVWIVGIEPTSWDEIRARYERMFSVATENGVACHNFESIFGATLEPPTPLIPESSEELVDSIDLDARDDA
jgi:restriction endonuclease BglII